MSQEQNEDKKTSTESFTEIFKTFGQAMSEIFNDPELKQKAKEFAESAAESAKALGSRFQDEDVKDIKEGYYSSSPLETVIGSLGYSQGFDEFFDDNPGAVDSVMEWIISINDFRNRLKQEFDIEELEKMGIYDLDEASTSAGAGSYMTPKAFGKADDDTIEALGYRRVQEAMDKKYAQLIEGYRSYVTDNPKMTSEAKVKRTITDVSKKLKEIEELVRNASRLKTESGMSKDGYGPRVEKALNKISERLIKISERVRSLGE